MSDSLFTLSGFRRYFYRELSADLCTVPFKYSLWLSFDLQKIDYRCVSESIYRYDISKNWFNSTKYYSNSSSCCYT